MPFRGKHNLLSINRIVHKDSFKPCPPASANGKKAGIPCPEIIDGLKHEFKTLDPGAMSNTIKNVVSSSIKRGGQARDIVIDARGSGLTQAEAIRGLGRAQGVARGMLDNITVIGDDFFINRAIGGL